MSRKRTAQLPEDATRSPAAPAEKPANLHKDHRARLRGQFLEYGLDRMTDYQALELLLFYAYPQRDTNGDAHRLLDAFGSLTALLDASPGALMSQGKLTENGAALLKLVPALARRQELQRARDVQLLTATEDYGRHLLPCFQGATEERVYALALDGKCKLMGCKELFRGSVNSVVLTNRAVVSFALEAGASSIVLAHNHPSGIALPSKADVTLTESVFRALEAVDVMLADHLVVAGDDFVSMRESGLMPTLLSEP